MRTPDHDDHDAGQDQRQVEFSLDQLDPSLGEERQQTLFLIRRMRRARRRRMADASPHFLLSSP